MVAKGIFGILTESFIPNNPRKAEIKEEIAKLVEKAVGIESDLVSRLLEEELYGESDEFPEHLFTQLKRIQEELPIPSNSAAIDLVVEGLHYDTDIEKIKSDTDIIYGSRADITELFRKVLTVEFPKITEESLNKCVSRLIDTKKGKYFVDAFIDIVAERSEVLRTLTDQDLLIDGEDRVIERLS